MRLDRYNMKPIEDKDPSWLDSNRENFKLLLINVIGVVLLGLLIVNLPV